MFINILSFFLFCWFLWLGLCWAGFSRQRHRATGPSSIYFAVGRHLFYSCFHGHIVDWWKTARCGRRGSSTLRSNSLAGIHGGGGENLRLYRSLYPPACTATEGETGAFLHASNVQSRIFIEAVCGIQNEQACWQCPWSPKSERKGIGHWHSLRPSAPGLRKTRRKIWAYRRVQVGLGSDLDRWFIQEGGSVAFCTSVSGQY